MVIAEGQAYRNGKWHDDVWVGVVDSDTIKKQRDRAMVIADDETYAMKMKPGEPVYVDDPFGCAQMVLRPEKLEDDFRIVQKPGDPERIACGEVTRDDLDRLVKNAKAREKTTRNIAKEALEIVKSSRIASHKALETAKTVSGKAKGARELALECDARSTNMMERQSAFIDNYNNLTLLMGRIEKYMKRLSDDNDVLKKRVSFLEDELRKRYDR